MKSVKEMALFIRNSMPVMSDAYIEGMKHAIVEAYDVSWDELERLINHAWDQFK